MGRTFVLPEGIDLECDVSADEDGLVHLGFHPNGRTDPATLRLTDTRADKTVEVGCLSASDVYRVLTDAQEDAP
jgi:hypothetical protein